MKHTYSFNFDPSFFEDAYEAVLHYERISSNLGMRFNEELQTTLEAIKRNPLFASVRYKDIRCAQLAKFPYLVHYHINTDTALVTIVAVYSTWQQLRSK
jgi:hypothetical protein